MEKTADPIISVIMPVYNVEPYLRQALDSVINQTWRNLQIILVDDGSPDNCGTICDEYAASDNRITVIHKENGGVSSARNAGIDAATGEWIYFMDSDDWIEPETLEVCLKKARDSHTDMVMFKSDRVDNSKRFTQRTSGLRECDGDILYNALQNPDSFARFSSRGSMCICLINRSIIQGKLFYDEQLYFAEDRHFRWRAYKFLNSFLYTPHVYYHYRITPDSANNSGNVMKKINGCFATHKKILETINFGGYPSNAKELENSIVFRDLISILTDTQFKYESLSYSQKRDNIQTVVDTDTFKNVLAGCCWKYLSTSTKIFLMLKRFPIFAVYLIHYLKKTQAVIRTMASKLFAQNIIAKGVVNESRSC